MTKKILSVILSLTMIFSCFSAMAFTSVAATDETLSVLAGLVKKFPAGKYWNHQGSEKNNPDGVTDTPCKTHSGCSWAEGACSCNSFDRAIQCMGYAHKIAYEITGVSPRASFEKSTTLDASKLRVGDIIRFRGDRHSICVTGVNGSQISFTDCNWGTNCIIRWGVMDISYLKEHSFTYVLHLDDNNRKNTNLTFYENPDKYLSDSGNVPSDGPSDVEASTVGTETWKMSDGNLNVRSSASLTASVKGSIPAYSEFKVTKKKIADGYLWGYVSYGSISGWAALDFSEYKSGYYQKPDIDNAESRYYADKITFSWNDVSGAESYLFRLYDSNKKTLLSKRVTDNKYTLTLSDEGKYYAKVFTGSSHVSSWIVSGSLISFSYNEKTDESATVEKITLSKSALTLVSGKSYTLTAKTVPADAAAELKWSSSDSSVVSVDKGELRAVDGGKAIIVCSDETGKIKAECEVTVKPGNISGAKQNIGAAALKSITLEWDKASSADSYLIQRYNTAEKKYEKLATVKTNSYTDSTVTYGRSYYYLIRAISDTESGEISGNSVKIKCSTKPYRVTGLRQSASTTGEVTLTWKRSRNASFYEVYKYDSSNKKYIKVDTVKTESAVINAAAGESAYYRVYAYTTTDWGNIKSSASDKVFSVAGPDKAVITVKSESVGTATVRWDAVKGATHYYVCRKTASGYKKIATVKSGTTSYTDKAPDSGTKQTYCVRAITLKGGVIGYGVFSARKSVTVK